MPLLSPVQTKKLTALASALIDQNAARVLVEPLERGTGFWFGGGNVIRDRDGSILICGRYRVYGDSRTGVHSGERGKEAAIFRAPGFDGPFEKIATFSKADLSRPGRQVVSIEGVALHATAEGIEFFVSSEKDIPYPDRIAKYLKPGAGVWSIDRLSAGRLADLSPASLEEVTQVLFCWPDRFWDHFGTSVGFALRLRRWFWDGRNRYPEPQPRSTPRRLPCRSWSSAHPGNITLSFAMAADGSRKP